MAVLLTIATGPFLFWPSLARRILATNFLPHLFCYLGKPGLVWTHVIADSLIGIAYLAICGTLVYLVRKGRRDIPFHWMFLAFGAFIVACGCTHFMEVVTVWIPVYVLSGSLKVVTALVSVATAVLLTFYRSTSPFSDSNRESFGRGRRQVPRVAGGRPRRNFCGKRRAHRFCES